MAFAQIHSLEHLERAAIAPSPTMDAIQSQSRLRRGYSGGVRPTRLGRVVEGMNPVVEGRAARHGLAEGGDVSRDGSVHDTAREAGVIGPLDQEAGLVVRVVRPGQGDCGRLLVLHDGASRQVGRGQRWYGWWCGTSSLESSVSVGQPPPGGISLNAGLE